MSLYQRRLASSTYAMRRSLENRARRLEEGLKRAQDLARQAPPDLPDPEELEEMEEGERERLETMLGDESDATSAIIFPPHQQLFIGRKAEHARVIEYTWHGIRRVDALSRLLPCGHRRGSVALSARGSGGSTVQRPTVRFGLQFPNRRQRMIARSCRPAKELHGLCPFSVQSSQHKQQICSINRCNRRYDRASFFVQFAFVTSPAGQATSRRQTMARQALRASIA
jgi:hypothetical protein